MRATDLITVERGFWLQGGAYYEANAAPDAWFLLPDPVGLVGLDGALRTVASGSRWGRVDLIDTRTLELSEHAMVLVYRAVARREGRDPYHALCASSYRLSKRRWLLAHHQQTPTGVPAP